MSRREHPWSKFWWEDYERDDGLELCSLSAQGLWMRMLCKMHVAEVRGYLTINGVPVSCESLAKLVRVRREKCAKLLQELEENRVFSRDDNGTIYCRRMAREVIQPDIARVNGSLGGNPNLARGTVPKEDRVRPFKRADSSPKTERIFNKNNGLCHWCGVKLQRLKAGQDFFHVDHLIPIRDGGTNSDDNLVPSCASCNHMRARKDWVPPDGLLSDCDRQQPLEAKKLEEKKEPKAAPLGADAPEQPPSVRDPAKEFFDEAAPLVISLTGMSRSAAGGFLVKLVRRAKDNRAHVLDALRSADEQRPLQPQGWLMEAVEARARSQGKLDWVMDEYARMGDVH